jgi:hypothetical protein
LLFLAEHLEGFLDDPGAAFPEITTLAVHPLQLFLFYAQRFSKTPPLDEDRWAGLYFVEDGCQSIP